MKKVDRVREDTGALEECARQRGEDGASFRMMPFNDDDALLLAPINGICTTEWREWGEESASTGTGEVPV